jgi:hypothetical protein
LPARATFFGLGGFPSGLFGGGQMDKVQDKASDKDKERVMKNINIMWNALSKNRLFDGNKELKSL